MSVHEKTKDYKDLAEKYKLLAENTVECIWLFDITDNCYKYISPSIINLRGFPVEEAIMEKLEDSLTPDSLKKVEKITKIAFESLKDPHEQNQLIESVNEFQQYCKDGTIKDIEISTKLIINKFTGNIEVLGVSRDISERKKSEIQLKNEICQKNELIKRLSKTKNELIKLTTELQEKNDILKSISITDPLTKIYNRRFLDHKISEEIRRSERYECPLSFIMFDLDNFKHINDTWGHDIGDEILIKITTIVNKYIHKPDIFARWGGEEFVILTPQTSIDKAALMAEKIRKTIEKTNHLSIGRITASFSIAERLKDESFESLFRRLDLALYRAKIEGKNRIIKYNSVENMPIALVKLEWKNEWECNNKIIDDQHKKLLNLSNDFIGLSLIESTSPKTYIKLDNLLDHVVKHFSDEEEILAKESYPNLQDHKKIHEDLVSKALLLKEKFIEQKTKPSAFFSFLLDDVITGHLLSEDKLFFYIFNK